MNPVWETLPALIASGVLSAASAADVGVHTFHCLHGCPIGAPETNDLIVREIYTLSSNDQTKFADWVAYRVTPTTIGSTESRYWRADPWLEDRETLEPEDYDGAHAALDTDRGHQAPLAAFTGTPFWRDTNLLSNITPQPGPLNQGPWQYLEAAVRDLATEDGQTVYVITGPLFERRLPSMPNAEPHHRPSGYWKVVTLPSGAQAGFLFDADTPRDADYCDHQAALEEIEYRARLDLLPRSDSGFTDLSARLGCAE